MKKRQIYLAVFILALLGLLSSAVYAQSILDPIFKPFQNINIGQIYDRYWFVVDSVMYFIILVGVSQFALSKQFDQGRGGKAVIIGVGVSLAIAASFFEYKTKFKLIDTFGPLAVIVVVVLFLVAVYRFAQALGAGSKGFMMLAFSVLFFYVAGTMPSLQNWFMKTGDYTRLIWALLNVLAIVFLIWGLIKLFSSFGEGGEEGKSWWDKLRGKDKDKDWGKDRDEWGRKKKKTGEPGEDEKDWEGKESDYDYTNPATLVFKVTDVDETPIKGATVSIKGPPRKGFLSKVTFRAPFSAVTKEDGMTPPVTVPAGRLIITTTHSGYIFSDMLVGGRRFAQTEYIAEPGAGKDHPVEVHIVLKREEDWPEPEIIGIKQEPNGVFLKGRLK